MKGAWAGKILVDPPTRKGLCWSLCLNWLKGKDEGNNLFYKIYDGEEKGKINTRVFESIRALQQASKSNQKHDLPTWLEMNGMREEDVTTSHGVSNLSHLPFDESIEISKYKVQNFSENLADAIVSECNDNETQFKQVSIQGKDKGHAFAVMIKPNSVTFFDPNFGEFEFPSKETFRNWFVSHFWEKSCYGSRIPGATIEMNKYFEIHNIKKQN